MRTNLENQYPYRNQQTMRGLRASVTAALTAACLSGSITAQPVGETTKLWYLKPAATWSEALPIGNGRLGGMVYGGVEKETITINEDTVWSGGPQDPTNPGAHQHLDKLRRLIRAEKYDDAVAFGAAHMLSAPPGQQTYQKLAELLLTFPGHASPLAYRRELDLADGVVRVSYRIGDATFSREILASNPDQVIAIRLGCDRPGRIGFMAKLATPHQKFGIETVGPDSLALPAYMGTLNLAAAAVKQ